MIFFSTSAGFWLLFGFYLFWGVKLGLVGALACTCILDNMILYKKKISILIVLADPGIFIRISISTGNHTTHTTW